MNDPDLVRRYFDRSAKSFDSLYSEDRVNPFSRWLNRTFRRDILERFLLTMEHVRRVEARSALDVGCGSGRYALALARNGVERIVGMDMAPGMLELARRAAAEAPAGSRLDFLCGEFMATSIEETFDVVIAMGFFDYVADARPVLERMGRLACHSVVVSFPSIHWLRTPIRKVRYWWKDCPLYFRKPDEIRETAAEAGLSRCEIVKIAGAGQDWFVTLSR